MGAIRFLPKNVHPILVNLHSYILTFSGLVS